MPVTALDVATRALRYVSSYAPYDVSPDQAELGVALECLDDLLAEKVGTEDLWYFVPDTQNVTLTAGESTYLLNTVTNSDLQFIKEVQVFYNGVEVEVELIRRAQYEELRDSGQLSTGDKPKYVYIERKDNPKMMVLPAPVLAGYSLKMWGQKYSPDVTQKNGKVDTEFPKAWGRCLALELAVDIGSGPVVTLQQGHIDRLEGRMTRIQKLLQTFNNKENVRRPRFTRNRNF